MNQIIKGAKYAVVNTIYPPKYSVIRLIGDTGYEHVHSFPTKKRAVFNIELHGGVLSAYNDTPVEERIIPYREDALRWHLYNNCGFTFEKSVEGVIMDIMAVNNGERQLTDSCNAYNGTSIAEMLEDLKIDYNTELV